MEYVRPKKKGYISGALNARGTENALNRSAHQLAPRVGAGTPKNTGATARSTSVETGHRSASGDRVAVRIVQRGSGTRDAPGAPVPQTFRQTRDYMIRALGGGA